MPLSLDELKRRQAARLAAARPAILTGSSPEAPAEDMGLLATAGDILAAPLRGVEGAVQDVYGLADTLVGDALPDYEERVFGQSRTRVGGLIEGISNFAAGFAAAGFVPLGWTAKLGRLAPLAEASIKGAIADFAVFDGHEERLSNLIQSFPALSNPVNEYLAADPKDSEIEGRFKNALEGLGVGFLTEAAMGGLKSLRAGRLARAAGKDWATVQTAMDRASAPEAIEASIHKANALPAPEPGPGPALAPSLPEAAAASAPPPVKVPEPAPVPPPSVDRSVNLLGTMDVSPEKAKQIMAGLLGREGHIEATATSLQGVPLDPRVNPRRLTAAERFEQGMQVTDLNLSRYVGPEGGLQYVRVLEQIMEPLKGLGDASRRTLNQQEQAYMKEFMDLFSEGNPQRTIVALQKDVQDLPGIMRRMGAYRIAGYTMAQHAYELAHKARLPSGTDKDILMAIEAARTVSEIKLGLKSVAGETARGLGGLRVEVPFMPELLDRAAEEEALHQFGGRKRAMDFLDKYRTLWESTTDPIARGAKAIDLAEGFTGRRAMGVLNEYWYNSLLGRPTTAVVTALSNALVTVYRPLELIGGGLLRHQQGVVADGVREIQALIGSASESWRATKAALTGEGQLLDPKSLASDVQDLRKRAISAQAFGLDPESTHGRALNWLGNLVRYPSAVLTATDQFFQQLNYRAVAKAQLTKEALLNPAIGEKGAAQFVTAEMEKLVHRGQAYGTAQLYHKGVEDAMARGLRSKDAVDEAARKYVQRALENPEHARLSSLADIAQRRAQEASFTTPLEPGTLSYGYQELVLNHWYLRLVTPFVRTPVNIIGAAADRTVRGAWGLAHYLAAKQFPALAPSLERSRNQFVRDMLSGSARQQADATGRLAMGMATSALLLTKAAEAAEDGLPLLTGRGPSDKETRQVLEEAGWQPYSIRIGNKYVSYSRLDPFASVMGISADIVNYVKYAAAEDQNGVEDVTYGLAVSLANNLLNKSYLAGLSNFVDMLHDPQRGFASWSRTIAASFVPGQAAAAVSVTDPLLRETHSILDALRARWPGASDDLPPLRNVLGEPVKRAQSLGSDASSILNAFVPILYREVSDDVVRKNLADLQHGFTPPKRVRGGLDLTTVRNARGQNAYDRWLELHGKVSLGSRGTLKDDLRRLFASPAYKRIPAESTDELSSPRIGLVQSSIDDYRAAAYRQLVHEFPELGEADRARVQARAAALRGQRPSNSLLSALQPRR